MKKQISWTNYLHYYWCSTSKHLTTRSCYTSMADVLLSTLSCTLCTYQLASVRCRKWDATHAKWGGLRRLTGWPQRFKKTERKLMLAFIKAAICQRLDKLPSRALFHSNLSQTGSTCPSKSKSLKQSKTKNTDMRGLSNPNRTRCCYPQHRAWMARRMKSQSSRIWTLSWLAWGSKATEINSSSKQ